MARTDPGDLRFTHLQSVLDCIDCPAFVTAADSSDSNDQRICSITDAFTTLTGYTTAEIVGEPPGVLFGCDAASPAARKFATAFARREKGVFTLRCCRKDGSRFQSAVSVHPLIENGRCDFIIAVLRAASPMASAGDREASLEAPFQALADGLGAAILIHRHKRPLFVNQAYVALFKYASHAAALQETSPIMNLPPDDAMEGRPIRCTAPRTDGLLLDLTMRSRAIEWNGRPATMLSIEQARKFPPGQDIPSRRRRVSVDGENDDLPLLRELLDSLPVILAHKTRDLIYTYVNKTYADWVEMPRDRIVGRHVSAVRNEAHFQLMKDRRDDVLSGKTVHYHTVCTYPGRGMRDMLMTLIPRRDPDGVISGYFSMAQDITDLKEIERALTQREEQLRLVMDSVPALISYRDRNLRYQYVNRPYAKWHGVARDSMIGRHTCEFISLATFQRVKPYIDRVLAGEPVRYTASAVGRTGAERIVDVSFVPHKDETDHVVGFFALSQEMPATDGPAPAGEPQTAPDGRTATPLSKVRSDPVS